MTIGPSLSDSSSHFVSTAYSPRIRMDTPCCARKPKLPYLKKRDLAFGLPSNERRLDVPHGDW